MRTVKAVAEGPAIPVGRSAQDNASERMKTALGFALVGASGIFVNQAALWLLVSYAGIYYAVAAIIATQVSTTWNFSLNELLVFRGRDAQHGLAGRFLAFWAINTGTLLLRIPMLALLTSVLHIHYLVSNLITLVVLFVMRFVVSDQLIWRPATPQHGDESSTSGAGTAADAHPATKSDGRLARRGFAYTYDIHGLASVASDVVLPELSYFRTSSPAGGADVEIRVGDVLSGPRRRIEVIETPGVMLYQEHLGRLGANFRLETFDRLKVTVSPLLARSPHVVYTNVVEALLRFVLASRDYALLHSATVVIDGQGIMLSAHTDTGKTATILRMLREHGGAFLSDDMTIVSGDGPVYSYPKPLTISHHTLGAIDGAGASSFTERTRLVLKSSLHSKQGRGTGLRLARMNLPIMTMNAVTQAMVPPPKYHVDELVPCQIADSAKVKHLILIARGPRLDELVNAEEALNTLVENTDDAYGFPPFRQLAPFIQLGGQTYPQLRRKERSVIDRMLVSGIRVRRMVRDDFSWADDIPAYVRNQDVPDLADYRSDPQVHGERAA